MMDQLASWILDPLRFDLYRQALAAGLLVSLAGGVIGCLVVLNRVVFATAGLAHAVYGGVGIGYFFGWNPFHSALGFGLLAALGLGVVERRTGERRDTLIGVLWAMGMALGVVLIDRTPGYKSDLMSWLFGSILTVPVNDLGALAALNLLILASVAVLYREWLALTFDPVFAEARNLPVRALHLGLLCLIALTVVLMMRVVGLLLVMALLTIPPALAGRWVRDLRAMMAVAVGLGMVFTVVGLYLAWWLDLTSGATIILVAGTAYLVASIGGRARPRSATGSGSG